MYDLTLREKLLRKLWNTRRSFFLLGCATLLSGCVASGESTPWWEEKPPVREQTFQSTTAFGWKREVPQQTAHAVVGTVTSQKVPAGFWQFFEDDLNRYRMELYLEDGRIFTARFDDAREFRTGDRVKIHYRGRKLIAIDPVPVFN